MPIAFRIHPLPVVLAALLATLVAAAGARAHGDPASHYLETQSLYPAFTNQASQAMELRLMGLLNAASEADYPIKVVMLGSRNDVPDTPAMVKAPQRYAEVVESQLEGVRTLEAPLLVVSPYGLGVSGPAMRGRRFGPLTRPQARALVRGVRVSRHADGDALARAAMTAVRRIARAGDRALPAHVPPAKLVVPPPRQRTGDGPGIWLPVLVFATVFLGAAVLYELWARLARRGRRPADLTIERETSERA
jgi:hypothetical protein